MSENAETTSAEPKGTAPKDAGSGKPDEKGARETTPRQNTLIRDIMSGSAVRAVLAIVLAMIIGGLLIAATNPKLYVTLGYFFQRPLDTWLVLVEPFTAMFRGSIYNYNATSFVRAIKPLTDTLNFATPLIAAGLGVALAFRVGLFNIGARGQMLMGVIAGSTVAFTVQAPIFIHLPLVIVAGMAGGMIWGGLVGLLKAKTGAHEVILTIMLNFIAFYFLSWLLATPGLLQNPGGGTPISAPTPESARFPLLFPSPLSVNAGFLVSLVAVLFVWWLIERSSLGFRMRAVGENPNAARAAGVNVGRTLVYAMGIAGALAGLAGVNQMSGTITSGFENGIDAGIGFDAITVALLGRSRAFGVLGAGLLFGALKAGSFTMQARGVPVDIVFVVQALIVLFIAAPPLIRAIFFLPKEGSSPRPARRVKKEVAA